MRHLGKVLEGPIGRLREKFVVSKMQSLGMMASEAGIAAKMALRVGNFGLKFRPEGMSAAFISKRWRSDNLSYTPNVQDTERARSVTSFYYQSAIDTAASKVSKGQLQS